MAKTAWIADLKQKLLTATDFADVLTFFFDHVEADPDFLGAGKPVSDPMVEQILGATARQVAGEKARIARLLLIRIADHRFLHGPILVNPNAGNDLYFEDVQMWQMSLVMSTTGETRMARITAMKMPMKADD